MADPVGARAAEYGGGAMADTAEVLANSAQDRR
jgi:hypothetical protein